MTAGLLVVLCAAGPRAASAACASLTNNGGVYTTWAGLGTPQQRLEVVADTGSYDLVVASTLCTTAACRSHRRFDVSASSTFIPGTEVLAIDYGQGNTTCLRALDAAGLYSSQWATMPSLYKGHVDFAPMVRESLADWAYAPYDGIMGLGKRLVNDVGGKAFLTSVGINDFTICLGSAALTGANKGGRMQLSQPIPLSTPYIALETMGAMAWATTLSHVGVSGSSTTTTTCSSTFPCAALLDTGTTLLTLPTALSEEVLAAIENGCPLDGCLDQLQRRPSCHGKYMDALPEITFTLGGVALSLPPSAYMGEMEVRRGGAALPHESTRHAPRVEPHAASHRPRSPGSLAYRTRCAVAG